jgi:class 3 adenylate cyclase/tetratricopeptide (TPR) repeat protein
MRCPGCQHENPGDAVFCQECGTRLDAACPSCATPNQLSAKFCKKCGHRLNGLATEPAIPGRRFGAPESYTPKHLAERILTSRTALEGERKQVTVLFADLKGSMELLADRDPEEARKLLDPVLERMMEAVHRYEGTVNQVMGDGIMALFGAPLAHEDHAVRACYAALRMQDAVHRYSDELRRGQGVEVQIRVGLNSGEVVVRSIGSDLRMDYTAVGQTTHLAARMEQLAAPGTVRLTGETLRFAEGYVEVRSLGSAPVKGFPDPIEVFELTGAGQARTRLQAGALRGLTRFVGRDAEIEHLRRVLGQAGAGHGQVAAIMGEAGVGKSRLTYEFTHSYRVQDWLILEASSVSYGKATSYLPVIDLLKGYFKIGDRDNHREMRDKVMGRLLGLDRALEPLLPPLLALLDVPAEDATWRALDALQRRQRTLDAVKRLLLRESQVQPLLAVFEDLHWVDGETQTLLDSLVDSLGSARLLLLVNYRPEYQHGWGSKTAYSQIRLDSLAAESAGELLETLLGDDPGLAPLKRLLVKRGNPFFLEETVRMLVETKALEGSRGRYRLTQPLQALQVPPTVQTILAARIDRLSADDKRLLQTAAVVGKDVPFALLQVITELPNEALRGGLDRLRAAEFLYETGLFPDLEYAFKHALTHEVTYGGLLQGRRRELHARIVDAIETLYAERLVEQAETLAHHALRGEVWEKAANYLRQAGDKAVRRSTYREAVEFFKQALDVLARLPETRQTLSEALDIRIALGPALIAIKGAGSADVEDSYRAAHTLCQRLGDTERVFPALWGLWYTTHHRAHYENARAIGEELLDLARRAGDSSLLLEAHHASSSTLIGMGRTLEAEGHCREGLALYDPAAHRASALQYGGHDPGVCMRSFSGWAAWELGYPEQALQRTRDALALASQLSQPLTSMIALYVSALVDYHRGDKRRAMDSAERVVALGRAHGIAVWTDYGSVILGCLLVQSGEREKGFRHLHAGRDGATAIRWTWGATVSAGLLGAAYLDAGQLDDSREILDALATRGREGFYEPECERLRGELLLAERPSATDQATACFRRAIDVARQRQAKSLELRAVMSLCRVLTGQGNQTEARRALVQICGSFTEGFDTEDLQQASALLEALS